MWKPFDGSVVNIQTHFQLEEHTVSKYEHKMWKPFDGSIQFSIKWKSSIGMALVTAQFRRNALEPPSPILLYTKCRFGTVTENKIKMHCEIDESISCCCFFFVLSFLLIL